MSLLREGHVNLFDPGRVICYRCGDRLYFPLDAAGRLGDWFHADPKTTDHEPEPALARSA